MYHPPQRIKHAPDPGPCPSARQAERSLLFSPIRVGPVTLEQRTWIPAMVPWRATESGYVTKEILAWYRRFAMGRPGALVVEATGVRDIRSGPLLRIYDDRFIPGLSELVETVREASQGHTRLFIQLLDFLSIHRRPTREKFLSRYLKISEHHRSALGAADWPEDKVRAQLLALDEQALKDTLTARE